MIIITRSVSPVVNLCKSVTVVYVVCCHLIGYAADPSVAESSVPDAVIGDVEKFKEMKGSYFLTLLYIACYMLRCEM